MPWNCQGLKSGAFLINDAVATGAGTGHNGVIQLFVTGGAHVYMIIFWFQWLLGSIRTFIYFVEKKLCYLPSVQFSHSVVSNSFQPHGLQHARPPCLSPTLRVYSNSCPLSLDNAIQPSHPLSSPSPTAFNLAQRQGLFQWVSSSHQMAKVLELQHRSFQWIFKTDFL